jgi:hypothetical protein
VCSGRKHHFHQRDKPILVPLALKLLGGRMKFFHLSFDYELFLSFLHLATTLHAFPPLPPTSSSYANGVPKLGQELVQAVTDGHRPLWGVFSDLGARSGPAAIWTLLLGRGAGELRRDREHGVPPKLVLEA